MSWRARRPAIENEPRAAPTMPPTSPTPSPASEPGVPEGRDRVAWLEGVERWRASEELDVDLWHERSRYMLRCLRERLAESPTGVRSLLDLGCGAMRLESMLAEEGLGYLEYLPVDAFARDERTLVLDLDDERAGARLPRADVLFLGGVLEYLSGAARLLKELAPRARFLCLSYCIRTEGQPARERLGWKSHLSLDQLVSLLAPLGALTIHREFSRPGCPELAVLVLHRGRSLHDGPRAALPRE